MGVRGTYVSLAVIIAAGILSVLFIAGCFNNKISAARAAAILKSGSGWTSVTCHPYRGGGGYWDYTCVVVNQPGERPFSFDVRVNGSGISEQSAP